MGSENDINTWAQLFLKYIISHPTVTCVIPATSNPKNLLNNLSAEMGRCMIKEIEGIWLSFLKVVNLLVGQATNNGRRGEGKLPDEKMRKKMVEYYEGL